MPRWIDWDNHRPDQEELVIASDGCRVGLAYWDIDEDWERGYDIVFWQFRALDYDADWDDLDEPPEKWMPIPEPFKGWEKVLLKRHRIEERGIKEKR
jgi:hypothetical protein